MSFRARLRRLTERVNALSLRERALLLLATCAVIFLLWDFAMMQPIGERQQSVNDQLDQVRDRVSTLTGEIRRLATERTHNPNAELESRREQLHDEIADLEAGLNEIHGGVSAPEQSVDVLGRLLGERAGVRIVELENLPVEPLTDRLGTPVGGVYIHRVRLVVESDFSGVREYLERVRDLPEGVFWDSMRLSVPGWPDNRVELVLYSLTFADNWLEV